MAMIDTRKIGAKGGKARAKNMTAAARSEAASKASRARWGPKKKSAAVKKNAKAA